MMEYDDPRNDPFIQELLPEFISDWIRQLDVEFPELVQNRDADSIRRFGHTLKGSCYQFGFPNIAELGIALMHAAEERNWEEIQRLYESIRQEFVNIQEHLE